MNTFENGFDDRGGFGGQEDFLGVFGQFRLVVGGEDQIAQEPHPIADVIALVVFAQTAMQTQ